MKIKEIAQKYNLGKDDFWELKRGTRSMWILHTMLVKDSSQRKYTIWRTNSI